METGRAPQYMFGLSDYGASNYIAHQYHPNIPLQPSIYQYQRQHDAMPWHPYPTHPTHGQQPRPMHPTYATSAGFQQTYSPLQMYYQRQQPPQPYPNPHPVSGPTVGHIQPALSPYVQGYSHGSIPIRLATDDHGASQGTTPFQAGLQNPASLSSSVSLQSMSTARDVAGTV